MFWHSPAPKKGGRVVERCVSYPPMGDNPLKIFFKFAGGEISPRGVEISLDNKFAICEHPNRIPSLYGISDGLHPRIQCT